MAAVILADLAVEINSGGFLRQQRLEAADQNSKQVLALLEAAGKIARPKAVYREVFIGTRREGRVVIDGVEFNSRILQVNLRGTNRVFPYVVTCGQELDAWSSGLEDMLEQYWADQIKEGILKSASRDLAARIAKTYSLGTTAVMNPGSLEDWPIGEQKKLFRLLGDPGEAIGVYLSNSCLMVPTKSVSGIRFATERTFENCQLCSRESCADRRAPYDPLLYANRYGTYQD